MSQPITPSTLCIGRRLLSSPLSQQRDVNDDVFDDARKRERFLRRVLNHFWKRWRKEYLTELREQHQVRNRSTGDSISHGDIVVVHEDRIPRQLWKVGRVEIYCAVVTEMCMRLSLKRRLKVEPSICKDRFNDCTQ